MKKMSKKNSYSNHFLSKVEEKQISKISASQNNFNTHSFIDYGGDDASHHNKSRIPSKNRIISRRYINGD